MCCGASAAALADRPQQERVGQLAEPCPWRYHGDACRERKMVDYRRLEGQMTEALGLTRRPVAVTFARSAPAGVSKCSGTEPAGCSFWRLAERGDVFYTEPGHHYNCAVGCFTHSIALPAERAW